MTAKTCEIIRGRNEEVENHQGAKQLIPGEIPEMRDPNKF